MLTITPWAKTYYGVLVLVIDNYDQVQRIPLDTALIPSPRISSVFSPSCISPVCLPDWCSLQQDISTAPIVGVFLAQTFPSVRRADVVAQGSRSWRSDAQYSRTIRPSRVGKSGTRKEDTERHQPAFAYSSRFWTRWLSTSSCKMDSRYIPASCEACVAASPFVLSLFLRASVFVRFLAVTRVLGYW